MKLDISEKDAIKEYPNASKEEKGLLEKLFGKKTFASTIISQVKTFEDACKVLGISTDTPDVSKMPKSHQKALIAHYKLIIIAEALNEGWKPDWSNWDEYKYYPWFEYDKSGSGFGFNYSYWTYTDSDFTGSRLCFKTKELSNYIGKQFLELYNEYFLM